MDQKKYWYFRFPERWFEEEPIQILKTYKNSSRMIILYQKLICKSLRRDGQVMMTDDKPYSTQQLATVIGCSVKALKEDLQILQDVGLIKCYADGAIFVLDIQAMIGTSSTEADRKRDYRKRVAEYKADKCPDTYSDKCPDISPIYKSKSDSHSNSHNKSEKFTRPLGQYGNVSVSEDEYHCLMQEFPNDVNRTIERLSEYIKITGKKYTSHAAVIRKWILEDRDKQTEAKKPSNPALDYQQHKYSEDDFNQSFYYDPTRDFLPESKEGV